ncbi:MAG: outer membrane protein assembly factor BamA, partial [Salinibacterium sp.]|nr:outer membrane protein assembly factor BamA [Salinibacterium sp.]
MPIALHNLPLLTLSGIARSCWVLLAVVLAAAVTPSSAQSDPEGRPVQRVELLELQNDGTRAPATESDAQFAANQIRTAAGGTFRATTVSEDLGRLNRTGRFRSVESEAEVQGDGSVVVTYVLDLQPTILGVQAAGNNQISDQQIAAQIDVLVGTPVDPFQIDRAARRIEDLYRQKGYYSARVTWDEQELEDNGSVVFVIREGEKLKVTGIRFVGNESYARREIQREIDTRVARFIFAKGQLDDDTLESDVAAIYQFYRDRGHLDVRVDRRVQPAPNNREAIVEFLIAEGPVYTLRSIRSEVRREPPDSIETSPPVFTAEQIAARMEIKPGDVYSINRLDTSIDQAVAAYQELGYYDVRIQRRELRDPELPVVDLLLAINEAPRYKIGEVRIIGNELTQDKVVRGYLSKEDVRPDRPLDKTNLDRAQTRLRQARLFDTRGRPVEITVANEDAQEAGYRDVVVQVAETNTGEFNIGALVNSDAGLIGQISLVQRNFDVFDTPDTVGDLFSGRAFRGAGQTFRIDALPGNQVQTYRVSLSEPTLFDTDLSGSAQAFFRQRQFREYDETRFGGRFGLGRNFGTRWQGNLSLRLESIELSDIDSDSPVDYFEVEDQNIITALGASLTRQTLDNAFRPSRGTRSEIAVQQAGVLGGDFNYTQFSGSHSVYIPIYEDFLGRRTVLELKTNADYIPQGQDEVPVYERFYLGGRSFRGFQFRTVSPKGIRNDNGEQGDEPVGGTWLFYAGAEVTKPIFEELLSVAAFVDSVTVHEDIGF